MPIQEKYKKAKNIHALPCPNFFFYPLKIKATACTRIWWGKCLKKKADSSVALTSNRWSDVRGMPKLGEQFVQPRGKWNLVWELYVQVTPTRHRLRFYEGRTKSMSLYRIFLGRFLARSTRASYRLMEFNAGFLTLGMELWNFNASFLISEKRGQIFRSLWMTSFRTKRKAFTYLRNSRFWNTWILLSWVLSADPYMTDP